MKIETNNLLVPDYMNLDFFKGVLEEGLYIINGKFTRIVFEMGSGAGDNYCSSIYRVKMVFKRTDDAPEEELSVIIKCIPITEATQFLENVGVYVVEKSMYQDIIPRMEILLSNSNFGAKMYYAQRQPIYTLAFEDLKVKGFTTAVRQDLLDEEHSRMIMTKLGQFHATSMVLAQRDPSVLNRYKAGMLSAANVKGSGTFKKMFGSQLKYLGTLAQSWPGFEKIGGKLLQYYEEFNDNLVASAGRRPTDITVLNHGDLWVNNFMFKYGQQSQRPLDSLLVDFQLCFYGSPGCDINFFLNSSVKLEILQKFRESFVETYYNAFKTTLEDCNYDKIPTLADIKNQVKSRERVGLFALFAFLPMVMLDKEASEESSIEGLANEETALKVFKEMFKNEKLLSLLKYGLKRFDDMGVIDDGYVEQ
ncbi:hypothetical protein ACFFRR_002938 [Megaselia abdita]